ncbi:hypothetical protein JCM8097_006055 [Rhodosporidiobolus ruineniae]
MRTIDLNDHTLWSWRQSPSASTSSAPPDEAASTTTSAFRPCAQFPGQIHAELLELGDIPDPFLQRNEELVQWVGEADWIYRCEFELSKGEMPKAGEEVDVVFEGLDTFCTVFVNGTKVLEAENMHREYRVSIASSLRPGLNTLYLFFPSAFRLGRELQEKHLGRGKSWPAWNGDPSRLFVRKAGYGYGWDWGPVLMTAGPYRPARLEMYQARILDFWPRAKVSETLKPTLSLSWQISSSSPALLESLAVRTRLRRPDGRVFRTDVRERAATLSEGELRFEEEEVELWWTAGLGKQPLYDVEVDLVDVTTGSVLDTVSRKVGFRRLRVLREPLADAPGHTFLFELNNVPLFAGGANWIPAHSILTSASKERYRRQLEMMVEANMNMVRVWGGGVYEEEHFYQTCDELGLLVWQDFAFACGAYPAQVDELRENIEAEVEGVVQRLRSHPSIALFAGNNEDYQIAESEGLQYDPEDKDGNWLRTNFPARELYERTFPRLVNINSDVFYWPGSPWTPGGKTTDLTEGDVHVWGVWHGAQEPYKKYGELGGRFVSEFGMEGAPDIRTVDYFLNGDKSERFPQSRTMDFHNKASGFERRIALYLSENIRYGSTLEDYVFATQLIQSEALSTALSAWRRKSKGGVEGAECAGALVWQLNDVWPCTSWSIVDYFLRPKPAYFAIKRALAPIAISGRRYSTKTFPDRLSAAQFVEKSFVQLWLSSSCLEAQDVLVDIEAFKLLSGKRVFRERRKLRLKENRSVDLEEVEIPKEWDDEKDAVVVVARVRDGKTEEVLSRVSLYPEPFKYLTFPLPSAVNLRVSLDRSAGTITAIAGRPVKGLVLSVSTDVKLSDHALDLVPGEEQVVKVGELEKETKLSWRYLGDEHVP